MKLLIEIPTNIMEYFLFLFPDTCQMASCVIPLTRVKRHLLFCSALVCRGTSSLFCHEASGTRSLRGDLAGSGRFRWTFPCCSDNRGQYEAARRRLARGKQCCSPGALAVLRS